MSTLNSRLSKLESAAGIGLSPLEQLDRLADSLSSETLLKALTLIRAYKAGIEPSPEISEDVVSLVRRIMALLVAAG